MTHTHHGKSSKAFFDADEVLDHVDIENKIVLDLGAGTGHIAMEAARTAKRVYAFDIHRPSVGEIKQKAKTSSTLIPMLGDANDLPFPDNSIDVTLLINVLHGFVANNEKQAIEEIKRVSKQIVVVEFKPETDFGPPKSLKLSPEQIEEVLEKTRKKVFDLVTHYGMIL